MAGGKARLPPRWFVVPPGTWTAGWSGPPGVAGVCGFHGRGSGARCDAPRKGRRGRRRAVIVGYFEDGPNLVTMAMNGWGSAEPAWWLNLHLIRRRRARRRDRREVLGRAAIGQERQQLWQRWRELIRARRLGRAAPQETAVVVLSRAPMPTETREGDFRS